MPVVQRLDAALQEVPDIFKNKCQEYVNICKLMEDQRNFIGIKSKERRFVRFNTNGVIGKCLINLNKV